MRQSEISKAFEDHLVTMANLPRVVWENDDEAGGGSKPYLVVQMVRTGRQNLDIAGGAGTFSQGFVQITAVTELGKWATEAENMADNIAAHFPKALRLVVAGGTVVVTSAPDIKTAFRDGPDWRLPVQIEYTAL